VAWDVSRVSHGAASPTEAATKRAGNKAVRPDARLVGDFINGIGQQSPFSGAKTDSVFRLSADIVVDVRDGS